jgi:hypothetical protein
MTKGIWAEVPGDTPGYHMYRQTQRALRYELTSVEAEFKRIDNLLEEVLAIQQALSEFVVERMRSTRIEPETPQAEPKVSPTIQHRHLLIMPSEERAQNWVIPVQYSVRNFLATVGICPTCGRDAEVAWTNGTPAFLKEGYEIDVDLASDFKILNVWDEPVRGNVGIFTLRCPHGHLTHLAKSAANTYSIQ